MHEGTFLGIVHLLEYDADVHACNKVGWTPAHLAALKGNTAILKVLDKAGVQLDVKDGVGCTPPLQLALRSPKQSIVTFLKCKKPFWKVLSLDPR